MVNYTKYYKFCFEVSEQTERLKQLQPGVSLLHLPPLQNRNVVSADRTQSEKEQIINFSIYISIEAI